MKATWLTAVGVCTAGIGLTQALIAAPFAAFPSHKAYENRGSCLLGSECLRVSKIPVTACRVTGKDGKVKDSCSIDGMKLIGKLTV